MSNYSATISARTGVANILAPDERARPVEGARRYWVTTEGRVISTCSGEAKATRPGVQTRGYAQAMVVRDDGSTGRPLVHVLVAQAFLVPPPVGPGTVLEVHHIDGDKLNNNVANLAWVTREEHARIELAIGGRANQKLTAEAVWKARCRALSGDPDGAADELVDSFGVRPRTAKKVVRGRTWTWVPMPWEPLSAAVLAKVLQVTQEEAEALIDLGGYRRAA